MSKLLALFLALLSVLTVAGSAWLLLPACGIAFFWANFCVDAAEVAAERRLAALSIENKELAREIARMERELSSYQCVALNEPPELEIPKSGEPVPEPPEAQSVPQAEPEMIWERRDVSLLEGCWVLDSEYRTVDIQTGRETLYTEWEMCFGEGGGGQAEMRATNGVSCSGDIQGAFNELQQLEVAESGNLVCSDQSFIYRRELSCSLLQDSSVSCRVDQPEVGRSSTVRLRRTTGDP